MNKIGTLDIIKAYLGNKELSANNAYIGEISLIKGSGPTPVGPLNDEIWYTSSDGNIVTPYPYSAGALPTIVSNTYVDGKGIIKFDSDLTSIGKDAFHSCTSLTSIEIPNSVTSIGDGAFSQCDSLTSVTIGNSVTSIGAAAFGSCTSLTSVTIPNSVTSIGESAFRNCSGMTSVTIPNSVISIGAMAFEHSSSLTSISYTGTIAQWYDISKGTLWNWDVPATVVHCTDGDTPISFPPNDEIWYTSSDGNIVTPYQTSSLPNIVSNTYVDGKGIIKFASNVTSIGDNAFRQCTSLTSITIPNSVTSIGNQAFYYCTGLTSITIPNSVTSIGNSAFYDCTGLTSVTIPNSVTSIGESAFYDCTGLTSVTIPNSVTSIGNQAFYNCTGLTSVTIPNSVTSIGQRAFSGCSGLTSPIYNTHIFAFMPTSYSGAYTIPNGIETITGGAFLGCTSLTSAVIPDSVTSIGPSAFAQISAKILFSKLYSTYTNKIFTSPASATGITCNVEFNISEIPTGYNISSMLPKGPSQSNKGSITYNIYTDYAPCKDQALALADAKTIVNVYHIDGTPWE